MSQNEFQKQAETAHQMAQLLGIPLNDAKRLLAKDDPRTFEPVGKTPAAHFRLLLHEQLSSAVVLEGAAKNFWRLGQEIISLFRACGAHGRLSALEIPPGPDGQKLGKAWAAYDTAKDQLQVLLSHFFDLDKSWRFSGFEFSAEGEAAGPPPPDGQNGK